MRKVNIVTKQRFLLFCGGCCVLVYSGLLLLSCTAVYPPGIDAHHMIHITGIRAESGHSRVQNISHAKPAK